MKKILPGLILTILIAAVAKLISIYFTTLGVVTIAIILGMIISNSFSFNQSYSAGIKFSEKKILEMAIVLMGFKLELSVVSQLGSSAFKIIIPLMLITVFTGIFISTFMGTGQKFGILMGVGSAVCGSSAIAAVAPAINPKENELGVSIGIVNLMGTIGIFFMPALGAFLDYSDLNKSYLIGGTLQAIGHVVAAGFSINDYVGDTATLIKMIRVLMIGPIALILALAFNSSESGWKNKLKIPPFIIGFAICSLLGTVLKDFPELLYYLKQLSKYLLTIAMAAIGMKIRYHDLLNQGLKALIIGVSVFSIQILSVISLLAIR